VRVFVLGEGAEWGNRLPLPKSIRGYVAIPATGRGAPQSGIFMDCWSCGGGG